MIDSLYIKKGKKTPHIVLDIKSNTYEIKGHSHAERIFELYNSVLEWMIENLPLLTQSLIIEFHFNTISSVSHKYLFKILILLKTFYKKGKNIMVNWYYDEDDEEIKEIGEDFIELITLPFEIIPVPIKKI